MINKTFYWITKAGTKLFAQTWEPDFNTDKPVIGLVHGLGEHSSRYKELPAALVNDGYKVISFDLRGHGKSEGKRGHISAYEDYMEDIARLLSEAKHHFSNSDLFLYGHSMGGNLVLNYALRFKPDIKGVIVTGPWLKLTSPPKPFIVKIAKLLDKVFPAFTTYNGIKPDELSHNEKNNVDAVKDDLLHPWITVHTYLELAEASCWALEHAAEFKYPLLILHGGSDKVTSPEGSIEFHKKAGEKSTIKILDDLYHEIHKEPYKDEIFTAILDWLNTRHN